MPFRLILPLFALALAGTVVAQVDERIVYTSVTDSNGEPSLNLTTADFIVREDGQAREVLRVERDRDPLQIALLVDNSAVMRDRVTQLRRAAAAFVEATRPDVEMALITLAERPTIAVPYTADRSRLTAAISGMFAWDSGNYMLDGIAEVSQGLAKRTARRSVIAVLTGLGPEMSYKQYPEVLRFLREGGASLHVLQFGSGIGRHDREIVVSRGTSETGGRFEEIVSQSAMEMKARQLATEISNQYRVTYARPQRLIPPEQVEIRVRPDGLRTRWRAAASDKDP